MDTLEFQLGRGSLKGTLEPYRDSDHGWVVNIGLTNDRRWAARDQVVRIRDWLNQFLEETKGPDLPTTVHSVIELTDTGQVLGLHPATGPFGAPAREPQWCDDQGYSWTIGRDESFKILYDAPTD